MALDQAAKKEGKKEEQTNGQIKEQK